MTKSVPLKYVAHINRRVLPETTPPDASFAYVDIGAVNDGQVVVPDAETNFKDAPSRARRLAPEGATIVSTVRTYLRAIASVPADSRTLVFSTGFAVLEGTEQIDARFLYYACRSGTFIDEVVARSTGVSYPAIAASDLGTIKIPVPRVEEQRRIADFLNCQVAALDRAISLKEQQRTLLDEHLEAEAHAALIGSGSVLTDGVQVRRLVAAIKTGGTPSPGEQWVWSPDGAPWYGPSSFLPGLHLGQPVKQLVEQAFRDRVVSTFLPGSVLIVGIGATAGRVAYLDHLASGNQQVTCLTPAPGVDGRFLAWSLWIRRNMLLKTAPYTTLPILNNETLKSVRVMPSDNPTQIGIAARLDQLAERYENAKRLLSLSQDLLRERKQALITAAVSGQFDVTTARSAA